MRRLNIDHKSSLEPQVSSSSHDICTMSETNVTGCELHNIVNMHHSQQSFGTIHFASFHPDMRRRPDYRCCRDPAARTARQSTIGFGLCPSCLPRGRSRGYRVSPETSSSRSIVRRPVDHTIWRRPSIMMKLTVGCVGRLCGVRTPALWFVHELYFALANLLVATT